jgi:hypothetical protein
MHSMSETCSSPTHCLLIFAGRGTIALRVRGYPGSRQAADEINDTS